MAKPVELVDGLENVRLGSDHQLDIPLDDASERVDALDVVGICAGHSELAVLHIERQHPVTLRERSGYPRFDEICIEVEGVDTNEFELGVSSDGLSDLDLAEHAGGIVVVGKL